MKITQMMKKVAWVREYITKLSHNEIEQVMFIIKMKTFKNERMGAEPIKYPDWKVMPVLEHRGIKTIKCIHNFVMNESEIIAFTKEQTYQIYSVHLYQDAEDSWVTIKLMNNHNALHELELNDIEKYFEPTHIEMILMKGEE